MKTLTEILKSIQSYRQKLIERRAKELIGSDLVFRLRMRASIRRQISTRKSVQEGKPDRIADLLEEAANEIEELRNGK
jgi:hypothetical protein